MALDHEIDALASLQEDAERERVRRWQRRLRLMADFRAVRAYRALFLDADGSIKSDAVTVIADLAAKARLGVVDNPAASDGELREFAGRRNIVLHLMARLDQSGTKLRELARKLREAENE